jgi:DNA-binding XRE family transcriptional regulator
MMIQMDSPARLGGLFFRDGNPVMPPEAWPGGIAGERHALHFRLCIDNMVDDDLALGEIIVYSGSILVIVVEVTGHGVAFQGGIYTSHRFPSLRLSGTGARRTSMKGSLYHQRDYALGQTFLTLRITIGLTQADLARHLGVSRKAVGEWEAGLTCPTAEHLKAFIALAFWA